VAGAALELLAALLQVQVQRRRARALHDAAVIAEREAGLQGVLQATEGERKRIARELHDGVGQQLTGLKFRIEEMAGKLERGQPLSPGTLHDALRMTDDAGREVRGIAHAMMPRTLEQLGLAAAMEDLFKRALNGTRTTYALDLLGMEQRMPAAMEVGLYRIIQELVQNTLKHADARQVDVQLLRSRDQVVLHYEDDGIGFGAATGQEGIGLRNIRERVHALGGRLDLHAGGHRGMRATVRIPVH